MPLHYRGIAANRRRPRRLRRGCAARDARFPFPLRTNAMTCPFVFLPEHPDFRSTCERSVFRKGSRLERNFLGTPVDFTLVADPAFSLSLPLSLFLFISLLPSFLSSVERKKKERTFVCKRRTYTHERKYCTRIGISFKKNLLFASLPSLPSSSTTKP